MNSHQEERSVMVYPGPPGSGLAYPRAGTAPRFRLSGLPFRKGALTERRDGICNRNGDACQEMVTVSVTFAVVTDHLAIQANDANSGLRIQGRSLEGKNGRGRRLGLRCKRQA
jgi:hypothetical protein